MIRRFALLCLVLTASATSAAAQEKSLYDKIDHAITKGVEYLRSCQKEDGSFGKVSSETLYGGGTGEGYPSKAGLTALALYTLLKCGVKPNDPQIVAGFRFIDGFDKVKPDTDDKHLTSYELSTMILALEARYNPIKKESVRISLEKTRAAAKRRRVRRPRPVVLPRKDLDRMQDWVDRLMKRRSPQAWRYNLPGGFSNIDFHQDMSSTQFACLALRAASHCHGVRIDHDDLYGVVDFVLENQDQDGPAYEVPVDPFEEKKAGKSIQVHSGKIRGFAYAKGSSSRHERASTGTMTTAGCASLIILKEILHRQVKYRKEYETKVEQGIRDAMMWVDKHWSMEGNPKSGSYFYYYLYGLERVGDLQGTLMIGKHYWYNEGAEVLVEDQQKNGAWQRADTHFPQDVINTCFALLFLDRATPPVAITGH